MDDELRKILENFQPPDPTPWDKVVGPYWSAVDIYSDYSDYIESSQAVPCSIRTLINAHWLDSEVCNGGFHQFFGNSTGILALEAIAAFGNLGLHRMQLVVRQAVSLFGSDYPTDREERLDKLSQLELSGDARSDWDPWYEMDDAYYSAKGQDGYAEAIDVAANQILRNGLPDN